VPEGIDPESITARFDRGILELHIPKAEELKPRRIAIAGHEQQAIEA
jgi:HSP20 family protein